MEEPAWKLLFDHIPSHLKTRFVYTPGKVTVRGLGVLKPEKQLDNLTEWFQHMRAGLPDQEGVGLGAICDARSSPGATERSSFCLAQSTIVETPHDSGDPATAPLSHQP
jgi:hypothetical protein